MARTGRSSAVDRRLAGARLDCSARDAGVVERLERGHRVVEPVVVEPDPPEHSLVGRRRDEAVGQPRSSTARAARGRIEDRRVDERPALPTDALTLRAGHGGSAGIAAVARTRGLPQLARLCLQLVVGRTIGAAACPEPLARVRWPAPRTRSPSTPTSTSSAAITRNATSSFVRTFAGAPATARTSRLSEPASAAHRPAGRTAPRALRAAPSAHPTTG